MHLWNIDERMQRKMQAYAATLKQPKQAIEPREALISIFFPLRLGSGIVSLN
jgi:hypothetical protein